MSGKRPRSPKAAVPRLALTMSEVAEALGVSADFVAEHVAPDLKIVRKGRKRLISVRELDAWLDRNAARTLESAG